MSKRKVTHRLVSHGTYSGWDRESRELPKIESFGDTIPARQGIEFGYILNIQNAKGRKLEYRIEHPPFRDDNGNVAPPFTGDLFIRTNDWDFYLGDTLGSPVDDKVGKWRLVTILDGDVLEDRTFTIALGGESEPGN